ncbi:MAG: hypothetical protein JW384_03411 [Nitrosomonadaceae bacterium]|nr:hypothetical protein [Nitrosomonadaceae bacterium]
MPFLAAAKSLAEGTGFVWPFKLDWTTAGLALLWLCGISAVFTWGKIEEDKRNVEVAKQTYLNQRLDKIDTALQSLQNGSIHPQNTGSNSSS